MRNGLAMQRERNNTTRRATVGPRLRSFPTSLAAQQKLLDRAWARRLARKERLVVDARRESDRIPPTVHPTQLVEIGVAFVGQLVAHLWLSFYKWQ